MRDCLLYSEKLRIATLIVFQVQDAIPASIGFNTSDGPVSTLSSDALFRRGLHFPSVKIITLEKNDSFSFDAYYVDGNELPPGTSTDIGSFQVCFLLVDL
jgi:heat shock 70kDa protein 4